MSEGDIGQTADQSYQSAQTQPGAQWDYSPPGVQADPGAIQYAPDGTSYQSGAQAPADQAQLSSPTDQGTPTPTDWQQAMDSHYMGGGAAQQQAPSWVKDPNSGMLYNQNGDIKNPANWTNSDGTPAKPGQTQDAPATGATPGATPAKTGAQAVPGPADWANVTAARADPRMADFFKQFPNATTAQIASAYTRNFGTADLTTASNASAKQYQQQGIATELMKYMTDNPGDRATVMKILGGLGIDTSSMGASSGLSPTMNPLGIAPSAWDTMPAGARQMITAAWQAQGGNTADLTSAIDAQRPKGSGTRNEIYRYAPAA